MRPFARLGLGVLAAGLLTGLGWWAFAGTRGKPAAPPHGAIDCPAEIDLGTVEVHRVVAAGLVLSNPGGGPVTVTGVATDCGCMAIRQLPDRREILPTTVLVVPAGGEVRIEVPVRVGGTHGTTVNHRLRFRTDVPDRPEVEVRIRFRPVARYFADPGRVPFGDVPPEQSVVRTAGLYATDDRECPSIARAVCDNAGRVRVTVTPDPAEAPPVPAEGLPATRRFARLRIEVAGLPAGESLDTTVRVYLDGRGDSALQIPVSAHARVPVELAPATVYLPRSSSAGPAYTATVSCRAAGAGPLELRVGPTADGLGVRVEDVPGNPSAKCLAVEADPGKLAGTVVVPLVARQDGRDHRLELRVVIEPSP